MRSRRVQNRSYRKRKVGTGKWFCEQDRAIGKRAAAIDVVVGIAGHVQHADARTLQPNSPGELHAADAGHDHVGQEQVNGAAMRRGKARRNGNDATRDRKSVV